MKVSEVVVNYERVTNLGNYSNMRIGAGMTLVVEEGDEAEQVMEHGLGLCRQEVGRMSLEILGANREAGTTIEEKLMGMRIEPELRDGVNV